MSLTLELLHNLVALHPPLPVIQEVTPTPSNNQDQLKGVVIYANMSLPSGAPSFYWEIELCSLGDSGGQEEGRHVGMGLSSKLSIPDGGSPPASFTFMKDTCLVRRYLCL